MSLLKHFSITGIICLLLALLKIIFPGFSELTAIPKPKLKVFWGDL